MNDLQVNLMEMLESRESKMIEIRRHLHANPELSFEETETAKYIAQFYANKDCQVETNVGGMNGVLITIKGGKPGKNLAIRADFDALPIQEDTGLEFSSKVPGVMHACGHDAHTAYMLVLAECLIELKDDLSGTVRIIHQPAEEVPPGGAKTMIESGCLDGIDNVLGIHVISNMPTGAVGYHAGSVHTGRATFKLKIQGQGGHGSAPQDAKDSIVAGSAFVSAVQTIVSRKINPFSGVSVTIGSFDGKGSANVIKDSIILEGDVRILDESDREVVEVEFKRILDGVCQTYDMSYELSYLNDYPVCVNDEATTDMVKESIESANLKEVNLIHDCGTLNPSEDFAYYAQEKPSCFFYVGAQKEGTVAYPHHHPKFMIDEAALLICAKAMASAVLYYMNKGIN